jgi:hypothetical protein
MIRSILALVCIASTLPTLAAAQQDLRWYDGHVSLMAGASVYQRSGSGTMGIYALRVDLPMYPNVLLDAGLSYAHRGEVVADLFIPDLQVQLQARSADFSPYIGLGAGLTVEKRDDGVSDVSFAPSFSAGMRVDLADGAGLRFEGRLHGVGANFRGVYSELAAGLSIAW